MKVTSADVGPRLEVPDSLFDSLLLRNTKHEFGLSKSKNEPMITCNWEIIGVRNKENGVDRSMIRDGQEYVIAGLTPRPTYHSLSKKARRFFMDWWCKCTGKTEKEFEIDDENPDRSFLNNLVMSAVCKAELIQRRKNLSDEEKEALKEAGQKVEGEVVVDDEGNPLPPFKMITVDTWNRRFTGELPAF